jgi:hypothetical protein
MRDVIVIGDVHGDGDRLMHVLQALGLVRDMSWNGGRTSLIMMGDVLDGAERSDTKMSSRLGDVGALLILNKLSSEAAKAGGLVTCIMGNHEIMNLAGQYAYVHRADMAKCGGSAGRASLMRPGGLVGEILSGWKLAHVENDTLFCHAGIHTSIAHRFVKRSDFEDLPLSMYHELSEHREYMTDGTPESKAALRGMLSRIGCRSMVIGHNTVDCPRRTWDGMVMMSDSKLSRAFGASKTGYVICVRPDGRMETISIPFRDAV